MGRRVSPTSRPYATYVREMNTPFECMAYVRQRATGKLWHMDEMDDLTPGSPIRRWRLGKRLRELRLAAGITREDAAEYLGVKPPTISRLELGKNAILVKNVKFLCQLYDVGAPELDTLIRQAQESNERGWWLAFSETMPNWFETYVGFEADAREIWTYESELVPGILQTPGYVRALRSTYGPVSAEAAERAVEFRLARQRRLEGRAPVMRVILNEAVLLREAGAGDDGMAQQIRHLLEMSERSFLDLRVLPFAAGLHRSMKGPFSLLTLPDEDDLNSGPHFVYVEHVEGAVYLERLSDLARYTDTFESLVQMALSPEETRGYLVSLM